MKILIYSSNSNTFDGKNFHYYNYPTIASFWEKYKNHNFIFIGSLPSPFLFDLEKGEVVAEYIVHDPENEFRAGYELSDNNEET